LKDLRTRSVVGTCRAGLPCIGSYVLTYVLALGAFGALIYLTVRSLVGLVSPFLTASLMVILLIAVLTVRPALTHLRRIINSWFSNEKDVCIEVLKRFNLGAGDPELETVASSLVTAVANGLKSRGVYLLLPSHATGAYSTYVYAGRRSSGRLSFSQDSPLVTTLKQRESTIEKKTMELVPSLVGLAAHDREALISNETELIAPLRNAGHLAGILLVGRSLADIPYSRREVRALDEIVKRVAVSIDDANYYENVRLRQNERQKTVDGIVHAISLAVEVVDPYTGVHQRRVAELAAAIARQLGLTEWQTLGVRVAGLLHDVGKLAVPVEILNKPGRLDPYELSIVRGHCRAGHDILEKIDFPWPVAQAVLQHHERLDGSGYPLGLVKEDIAFEARILGVADVVEAMSSHRPYRPSLGLEAALDEVARESGILYDADVVEACLGLLSGNSAEFERIMAAAAREREPVPEKIPA
jgi:putative nucleotidyltransferase with HDIG domain